MLCINLKKEEIDKLKLLLYDIELLQKLNNIFDNEAIEILSFKVIENINKDNDTNKTNATNVTQFDEIKCDYCSKIVKKYMAIDTWMITDNNNNVCYGCQIQKNIGWGKIKQPKKD